MIAPTTWRLVDPTVIDGDTLRGTLERDVPLSDGWAMTVYSARGVVPASRLLRLITIDTPERGAAGWRAAGEDVRGWLAAQTAPLLVDTYESAGWDRTLADVYPAGQRNATLSEWMLLRGWPPYLPR